MKLLLVATTPLSGDLQAISDALTTAGHTVEVTNSTTTSTILALYVSEACDVVLVPQDYDISDHSAFKTALQGGIPAVVCDYNAVEALAFGTVIGYPQDPNVGMITSGHPIAGDLDGDGETEIGTDYGYQIELSAYGDGVVIANSATRDYHPDVAPCIIAWDDGDDYGTGTAGARTVAFVDTRFLNSVGLAMLVRAAEWAANVSTGAITGGIDELGIASVEALAAIVDVAGVAVELAVAATESIEGSFAAVSGSLIELTAVTTETLSGAILAAGSVVEASTVSVEEIDGAVAISGLLTETGEASEETAGGGATVAAALIETAQSSTETVSGLTLIIGGLIETAESSHEQIANDDQVAGEIAEQAAPAIDAIGGLTLILGGLAEQADATVEELTVSVSAVGTIEEDSQLAIEIIAATVANFAPEQLATLVGHWVADDISGSSAAAWADRSTHGNDLAQATSGAQLAVVSNDADFNGHKSVQGASGDNISRATYTQGSITQPFTLYAVLKLPATWVTQQAIVSSANASNRADLWARNNGELGAATGSGGLNVTGVAAGARGILRGIFDGATSHVRWTPFSGSEISVTGTLGTNAGIGITIGAYATGTNNFTGKIADVLSIGEDIRDNADPALDAKIMAYLVARYVALSASLSETAASATEALSGSVVIAGGVVEQAAPATETIAGSVVIEGEVTELASPSVESVAGLVLISGDLVEQAIPSTEDIGAGTITGGSLAETALPAVEIILGSFAAINGTMVEQGVAATEVITSATSVGGSMAEVATLAHESLSGFTSIGGGLIETAVPANEQIRSGLEHDIAPFDRVSYVERENRMFGVEREFRRIVA